MSCGSNEIEASFDETDEEVIDPAEDDLPQRSPPQNKSEKSEDEGFDPCPRVKYLLLEKDGIKYYMEMDVPCEPIQNINLGCPSPV